MNPTLRLLLLMLAPWALAAAFVLGARGTVPDDCARPCATDTECMDMHGGDGGPEPLTT